MAKHCRHLRQPTLVLLNHIESKITMPQIQIELNQQSMINSSTVFQSKVVNSRYIIPLGPYILCPLIDIKSTFKVETSMGIFPIAWAASVWKNTFLALQIWPMRGNIDQTEKQWIDRTVSVVSYIHEVRLAKIVWKRKALGFKWVISFLF